MRLRCGGAASDRHAWSPEVLDLEAMRCGLSATVAVAALSAPDLRHAECQRSFDRVVARARFGFLSVVAAISGGECRKRTPVGVYFATEGSAKMCPALFGV